MLAVFAEVVEGLGGAVDLIVVLGAGEGGDASHAFVPEFLDQLRARCFVLDQNLVHDECAAPITARSLAPAIEDRLVLALIIRAPQRECVLGPDDEGLPMPTGLYEG